MLKRRRGGGDPELKVLSPSEITVYENAQLRHDLVLNWKEPGRFQWAITGGTDAARFQVVFGYPWMLQWAGDGVQDFEVPLDSDLNNVYVVQVTATDTVGSSSVTQEIQVSVLDLSEIAPINTALPVISGIAAENRVLDCSTGAWSGPIVLGYAYQWVRDGSDILGETTDSFLTHPSDAGTLITCRVTATNLYGSTSAVATQVGPITGVPVSLTPPVIAGSPVAGALLTATPGSWGGYPLPTFSYQWKRGIVNVGTDSATYTTVTADIGSLITCVVTATSASGTLVVTSNEIGPVVVPAWVSSVYGTDSPSMANHFRDDKSWTTNGAENDNSALPLTVTRASVGYAEDLAGVWTQFATNTARRTNKGLLIETGRTNSIRNNSMQGAVVGTPGTLPTNWASALNGVSQQVVGVGTENGLDYIDLRIFGTTINTSMFQFRMELNNNIVAANGQTWTGSLFYRLVGGSMNNITTLILQLYENDAAGAGLANSTSNFFPTSTMQRVTLTRVFNQASTAFTNLKFSVTNTNAAVVDATFRVYSPQLELGAFVTSPIRTTTVAVARASDNIVFNSLSPWYNAPEGTMFVEGLPITGSEVTNALFQIDDGGASNRALVGITGVGQNSTISAVLVGGVSQQAVNGTAVAGINRACLGYKLNDFNFSFNGGAVNLDTTGTIPTVTTARLGSNSAAFWSGYLRRVAYWPTKQSNTRVVELTSLVPTLLLSPSGAQVISPPGARVLAKLE